MLIDLLAYLASATIIGTYYLVATERKPDIWFHWANAIGAIFTGISTYVHHAYPSLVLTVAFGTIGTVGILKHLLSSTPSVERTP